MSPHTQDTDPLQQTRTSRADLISDRAAELADRRLVISADVDLLMSGWSGERAQAFSTRWEEWSHGAAQVIDALSANIASLHHANAQIVADEHRVPRPRSGRS